MAYVEYESDGKTIKARVMQKTDTLANWEANQLVLLQGEQAFVVDSGGTPINFKIGDGTKTFSELPWWIAYDQGQYVTVSSNALPTPEVEVGYSFVGPGTYTFTGQSDIVAPDGRFSQLVWNGSSWSLKDMGELPMQDVSNLATTQQVNLIDSDVQAMMDGFYDISRIIPTKPFNSGGYINIFGTTTTETGWFRTSINIGTGNLFPVTFGNRYYYSGQIEDTDNPSIPAVGVAYFNSAGSFIGYECRSPSNYNLFRLSPPANAAWIGTSSKTVNPVITEESLTVRVSDAIHVDVAASSGGDGTVSKPFNTISAGLTKLANTTFGRKKLVLSQGDYRETIDLASLPSGDFEICAKEGHKVRILGSNKISGWTKTSGQTNVYQASYSATIPVWGTRNNPIFEDGRPHSEILPNEIHPLQKNLTNRLPFTPIYEVGSIEEVDANPGTYCRISGVLYIHTSDSSNPLTNGYSYESITNRPTNTYNTPASTSKKVNILMLNIQIFYTVGGLVVSGFDRFIGYNISAFATTSSGLIRSDTGNNEFWYCECAFGDVDGFNNHFNRFTGFNNLTDNRSNYATVKYFGCWAHDNGDDGESSHEQHNVYMDGFLSEYNGDSGSRGSNDATYIINNALFRRNGWEVGLGGGAGKGEGFALVNASLNPSRQGCRAVLNNVISEDNNTGFGIVNNNNNVLILNNCVARNNFSAEYYAGAGVVNVNNSKATNSDESKKKVVSGTGVINIKNDDLLV